MPKSKKRNSALPWLLPAILIGLLSAVPLYLLMGTLTLSAWCAATFPDTAEIDGPTLQAVLEAIKSSPIQSNIADMTACAVVLVIACTIASAFIARCIAASRRKPYRKRSAAKATQPPATIPLTAPSAPAIDDDDAQYRAVLMTMPYARKNLLTKEERKFWYVLLEALRGRGVSITVKPSLKEFVQVPSYSQSTVSQRAWREIAQKHVDFLICEKGTMKPLFAVEYDGDTHSKLDASNAATVRSDEFKDQLFAKLGIPLIRVPYGNWTADSLRELLNAPSTVS